MVAAARMSPKWALRIGLVSVAFVLFAGWCIVDAKVGYPRFNQRAAERNRLHAEGRLDEWPALAAARGWDPSFRKEDIGPDGTVGLKTRWDIGTQYVMMVGCMAVAAVMLARLLRARGRSMRAEPDCFVSIEGQRIPYGDIVDIDLKLWQRKSIARVHFRQGDQRLKTTIDDWIYQGGENVLAEIQRRTGLGTPTPAQATPADQTTSQPPREATVAGAPDGKPTDRAS